MNKFTIEKNQQTYEKPIERAIAYYRTLFALNNIKLQKKELELLAFTSIRGTITPPSARQEFCEQFKTTINHTENLKASLIKKGYLVKKDSVYRVLPALQKDFSLPLIMQITLK